MWRWRRQDLPHLLWAVEILEMKVHLPLVHSWAEGGMLARFYLALAESSRAPGVLEEVWRSTQPGCEATQSTCQLQTALDAWIRDYFKELVFIHCRINLLNFKNWLHWEPCPWPSQSCTHCCVLFTPGTGGIEKMCEYPIVLKTSKWG